MSEYRRWRVEGGSYFFTIVTADRRPILTSELGRSSLRHAFQTILDKKTFDLIAIVLLPDHLHCIWQLPNGDDDYSSRWADLKSQFTDTFLKGGGTEAPISESRRKKGERGIWQRRFWEHTIRDDDDFKRCLDYGHWNPVKHGYVQQVKDWPWSSFHRWVRLGEYELDWGNVSLPLPKWM